MELSETRMLAYDMMSPFIVSSLLDDHDLEVEDLWGGHAAT